MSTEHQMIQFRDAVRAAIVTNTMGPEAVRRAVHAVVAPKRPAFSLRRAGLALGVGANGIPVLA